MQKLNAFWSDHICEKGDARNVASGVTKARDKAQLNGAKLEHDGNCLRRRYCRKRYDGAAPRDDDGNVLPDQVGGQRRQSLIMIISPPVFDGKVATFDVSIFSQSLAKGRHEFL